MNLRYKRAVELLTNTTPREKFRAWQSFNTHPAGPLFRFCTPNGRACIEYDGVYFGCPIMISGRGSPYRAWTQEWTTKVKAMGLPSSASYLTREHLLKLGRLQTHMDETIRSVVWRNAHRCQLPYAWWEDKFESSGEADEYNESEDD